jgi:hypothetical protein
VGEIGHYRKNVRMTVPTRKNFVIALTLVLGSFAATPLLAQDAPQLVAQNCTLLSAPPQVLSLASAVPAGATLLVSVALDSNNVSGLSVSDSAGSGYVGVGGYQSPAAGLALAVLRAPLERALPSGSQVKVDYVNASANTTSCVQIHAARGVAFSGESLDTSGAASSATSTQPHASTASLASAAPLLHFAAFASNAVIGSPVAPALSAASNCAPTVCLNSAYDFSDGDVTATISFDGTAPSWLGTIGALYDDDIFGNGYN